MLLEIICSNLLSLSVDLTKCSSTKLEQLTTLSGNQTSMVAGPIEQQIQLAKGKPNQSRYREEADRERERREIENIRERGYDNRRRIENNYENYRYDRYNRGRIESIREQIEDIEERIDDLEREKKRLEELERRYRRRYY